MKLFPVLALLMVTAPAAAQTEPDPASTARMRLGPLALTPAIAFQNIGIDSNVFNEAENPKQDFTATLRPQVEAWLRLGRARLSLDGSVEAVYFKHYSSERSINGDGSATLDFRWNRLSVFAGGNYLNTRERQGFEIDVRSRRVENTLTIGSNVRLSGKTALGVQAGRRQIDFDADAGISGTYLSAVLNRHEETATAFLEHKLTTLTTLLLRAGVQRDTFDFSPLRDSLSVRVMPGVQFKPRAIVSGSAFVGYRKFETLGATVPAFSGACASVDLGYTLRGMTRFAVQSARDVEYSFEPLQPYYLITGVTGSVSQALSGSWHISASAGKQRLNYRQTASVAIDEPSRVETVNVYGADRAPVEPRHPARSESRLLRPARSGAPLAQLRGSPRRRLRDLWPSGAMMTGLRLPARPSALMTVALFTVAVLSASPCVAQSTDYIVGPQDVLTITVWDQPDLTGKFGVETDGTFSFPLIGRVKGGGLTLREVEAELKKRLSDGYFRNPQLSVAVEQYRSQRIYIVGEVRQPGTYPLTGDMTLIEAFARAGSATHDAAGHAVIVRGSTGRSQPTLPDQQAGSEIMTISLKELETGSLSTNVALRDGDTIFVPRAETIHVFGQVKNPGVYPIQKDTTVLQALSLAGGVGERGSTSRVRIVRLVDGTKKELSAKLSDPVRPGDTIIVLERFF
jgi:polysaccharide export outer membrane protein